MTLVIEGLSKRYGGLVAVDAVSMMASPGEITALIGPNGAGKTTLLNLISGVVLPDQGEVKLFDRNVTQATPHVLAGCGLTRTYQTPQLFSDMSVLENVMVGAYMSGCAGFLSSMFRLRKIGREERLMEHHARQMLQRAGLSEQLFSRNAVDLAYGQQRRVEIARALATNPKAILLDEPAAGLNPVETDEISALISGLASEGFVVVLVEHDMDMIMEISHKIVVMNFGRKIAEGTPESVQSDERVIEAYLGPPASGEATC